MDCAGGRDDRLLSLAERVQGAWVQFQAPENPTCLGATKPVHHDY